MTDEMRSAGFRAAVAAGLVVFYLLTAPENHSTALDSYGFAYWITEKPITAVPELRDFLWVASMQAVYAAASWAVPRPDPFVLIGALGAIETALAVILLQTLFARRFRLSSAAAWTGALCYSVCYGVWRYAGEIEIYAAAALIAVSLVYAAFSLEHRKEPPSTAWLASLAAGGGLATLCYQPLGIVAGLAIPTYLTARLGPARVILYYAVCGAVVLTGLLFANAISGADPSAMRVQSIFDTDGKPVVLPGATDLVRSVIALMHNLLSINWTFAFEPTRTIYETQAGGWYAVHLYPAQFAPRSYLVFLFTIPAAGALTIAAFLLARRFSRRRSLDAMEMSVLVWLAGQAAIVLTIDPVGLEPWVPSLLPIFILVGTRLLQPLSESGHAPVGIALAAVFLVHNWFAGIGVQYPAQHNYRDVRVAPLLPMIGADDLLVIGSDWSFKRYLDYRTDTPSIELNKVGGEAAGKLIEETLARGGKVILFDDVMVPPRDRAVLNPAFATGLEKIARTYLSNARRIKLDDAGYAFEILPPGQS
jgi:hypothetical protein